MINEIKHLYPNADPLVDFELRDNSDGKGPFIARWDTVKLGAQPTAQQLAVVSVAANLHAENKIKNAAIERQLAAADLKIIRALTEGDTVRIGAHNTAQTALRAKLI